MIPKKFQSFVLPQHKRMEGSGKTGSLYTGKKRGPKKHGPVARYLRMWIREELPPISKYRDRAIEQAGKLLGEPSWWQMCATDDKEFRLCIAMAYAIALDQGV